MQQRDIQRTEIGPYWAVPPGSPGWQLKRQNLSCLCCWFIVSASLCACWRPARDSLKLPFLERRQFKWNLSALALTFQKKKKQEFHLKFPTQSGCGGGGGGEATAPTCWYFSLGSHHQPPPGYEMNGSKQQFLRFNFSGEILIPKTFSSFQGKS